MNEGKVEISRDLAKTLYEQLLAPRKDIDGGVYYPIYITLAAALRMEIGEQVK